jgi:aspartate aminotransferase
MTGWRIGYLVGSRDVVMAATDIQSQVTSNPTSISQWASVEALSGNQEAVREMSAVFEKRSRRVTELISELPGVTCPEPDGAFYVFPNFSHYYGKKAGTREITSSLDMADYLMEAAHVAVVPGSAFGEDRCVRFSYALSMEEIEKGFNSVAAALKNLK